MKTARLLLALAVVLLPLTGLAQSETHKSDGHDTGAPASIATGSHGHESQASTADTQQWFERLKTLEGTWEGNVTVDPFIPEMAGAVMKVTMRVTSLGNAIMHNMRTPQRPDDPITMLYLENDRLLLTHYCDAGNRPRMEAKISPDGKTIAFEFIDLAGPTKYGHMNRAAFTFIDADHHIEEWTYMLPNNTPARVRFDLRRVKQPAT